MNEVFFTTLTGRLTELTSGLAFTHQPTGEMKAPQIINVMLERPTGPIEEGDKFPFVRWIVVNGEFARMSAAPFTVMLDFGIYTAGTIDDGNRDIMQLTMALGKIVNTPWFSPYKLNNRVRFTMGYPDDHNPGSQPHPYYLARLYLDFTVAKFSATEG